MATGKIKKLVNSEYGYIQPDNSAGDVKFFLNQLQGQKPTLDLRVEYEARRIDHQRVEAKWVRPLIQLSSNPVNATGGVQATPQQAGENPDSRPSHAVKSSKPDTQMEFPTLPSHNRFLNPYNFVRYLAKERPANHILGNCPPPPHDRYTGLTGSFTCRLTNVTPLFIADSHDIVANFKEQQGHHAYRFFRQPDINGKDDLAIPASSLRGMIRSAFEAATNSCFGIFDNAVLSHHLDSRRAPWLVPARVEKQGEQWQLRLLTGKTPLQLETYGQKNPNGTQYAAWLSSYWPVKASKTLQGVDPRLRPGQQLSQSQRQKRSMFIRRTQDVTSKNSEKICHGEECYAHLRRFQHPHPKIEFWDVVKLSRDRSRLPKTESQDEIVVKGWLCLTNQNIESKHSERFFFRHQQNTTGPQYIDLPEETRNAYQSLIEDYQQRHAKAIAKRQDNQQSPDQPVGNDAGFSRFICDPQECKIQGGELVYAMLEGNTQMPSVKFIVPVSVPRIVYERRIGERPPVHLHRCTKYDELCPACRMFGWAHEDAENLSRETQVAYAGRVCFSFGKLERAKFAGYLDENEMDGIPLAILGTPKPTTTPFYLLKSDGKPADDRDDYNNSNNHLRGRKFYRHHGEWEKLPEKQQQEHQRAGNLRDNQNRTVKEVLKPGSEFTFTVNFENMQPVELGALLWSFQFEPEMFHRLGFAKPLGFGSVKIEVLEETLTFLSMATRYASLVSVQAIDSAQVVLAPEYQWSLANLIDQFKGEFAQEYGNGQVEFKQLPNIADLIALLSSPRIPLPIHYPRQEQARSTDGENFKWFVGNKKRFADERKSKSERKLRNAQRLPIATDDHSGLEFMDAKGK